LTYHHAVHQSYVGYSSTCSKCTAFGELEELYGLHSTCRMLSLLVPLFALVPRHRKGEHILRTEITHHHTSKDLLSARLGSPLATTHVVDGRDQFSTLNTGSAAGCASLHFRFKLLKFFNPIPIQVQHKHHMLHPAIDRPFLPVHAILLGSGSMPHIASLARQRTHTQNLRSIYESYMTPLSIHSSTFHFVPRLLGSLVSLHNDTYWDISMPYATPAKW